MDFERLREEYLEFRDALKRNYVDKTVQLRLTDFLSIWGELKQYGRENGT